MKACIGTAWWQHRKLQAPRIVLLLSSLAEGSYSLRELKVKLLVIVRHRIMHVEHCDREVGGSNFKEPFRSKDTR